MPEVEEKSLLNRASIKSVRVKNFKRLDELQLELGNLNILVGPNNSGKSSFIQGLQFGVSALQSVAITPDGNGKLKPWKDDKISSSLQANKLIYTPVAEPTSLGKLNKFSQSVGMETRFESDGGESCDISIKLGRNKNLKIDAKGERLGSELQGLDPLYSILAPGLAGIAGTEEYRSPGVLRRAAARGDSNNYLRNFVYLLRDQSPEKWKAFLERLDSIFPGIDLEVQFSLDHDEFIQCYVKFDSSEPISLDLAGTGVLQAVQILTYVGLYSPNLLMLDEPDSHLHPSNQRKLIQTLSRVAEEDNCKVIITTHSRHIVDEARALESSLFWLSEGKLQSDDVSLVQNLMDLGALDIGELGTLSSLRGLILTEDENGAAMMRCIALSNGWEDSTYKVSTYNGGSNRHAVKLLLEFIRSSEPDLPIVVYRDRDFNEDTVDKWASLEEEIEGVYVIFPDGPDSESLLLSDNFLEEFGLRFSIPFETLSDVRKQAIEERKKKGVDDLAKLIANEGLFDLETQKGKANPPKQMEKAKEKVDEDPLRWIKGKLLLKTFDHQLRQLNQTAVKNRLDNGYQSLKLNGFPAQR